MGQNLGATIGECTRKENPPLHAAISGLSFLRPQIDQCYWQACIDPPPHPNGSPEYNAGDEIPFEKHVK